MVFFHQSSHCSRYAWAHFHTRNYHFAWFAEVKMAWIWRNNKDLDIPQVRYRDSLSFLCWDIQISLCWYAATWNSMLLGESSTHINATSHSHCIDIHFLICSWIHLFCSFVPQVYYSHQVLKIIKKKKNEKIRTTITITKLSKKYILFSLVIWLAYFLWILPRNNSGDSAISWNY